MEAVHSVQPLFSWIRAIDMVHPMQKVSENFLNLLPLQTSE